MKIRKSLWILALIASVGIGILMTHSHGTAPVVQNPAPAQKPAQEGKIDEQSAQEKPIVVAETSMVEQVASMQSVPEPQAASAVNTNQFKMVKFSIKPQPPQFKTQ